MGVSCFKNKKVYPKLDILILDEEKEMLIKNKIGPMNFKDLFIESLSGEFLILFEKNKHLFYAKSFFEGICKEYGLFSQKINIKEAYKIYKNGADFKYDYLCMYRLHRIYLFDYRKFDLERNFELDRLYLYKCYAYIPYKIIDREYDIFNKHDITNEIEIYFKYLDNSKFTTLSKFLNFLTEHHTKFDITLNDIRLMDYVISSVFKEEVRKDYSCFDDFLKIKKEKQNVMAYYELQLKYCNFNIDFSGKKCDKNKINDIFDKLINSEYYKASLDYGKFLISQEKYDEAKRIFKLGMDKSQQFCLGEYAYCLLMSYEMKNVFSDYKIITNILNIFCLHICIDKLSISSFYYAVYYLTKHSSFKDKVKQEYHKYVIEIYKNYEKLLELENYAIYENYSENIQIQNYLIFGRMCYYGVKDLIESNKEKSLNYFKKAYKLAKEKDYDFLKRISYLYM